MSAKPKTWKEIPKEKWDCLQDLLLSNGGLKDKEAKGISEVWRIRLDKTVFTLYNTGTLFSSQPSSKEIVEIHDRISEILGATLEKPEKTFLIGLDETGKGEVLGHSVLAVAIFPSGIINEVNNVIGPADTKKRKSVQYWDRLFLELDALREKGLDFSIEKIPPWHVDKFNLNKIMDVVYQRILSLILLNVPTESCRIILDDYGIGRNLSQYLETLHKKGAEVRVESKADEKYVEVKLASIVAKRERVKVMEAINRSFSLPNTPVGSGNAGDPETVKWLIEWKKTGREWPWFVKQSFANVRKINGKTAEYRKIDPPIKHELLSRDSRTLFREGKLSVESLSVVCPTCGATSKSCKVTPDENGLLVGRCNNCSGPINNLNTTLLYYCGYIVPDSSVIIAGTICKDLEKGRFFEGFTFFLHPKVFEECDNKGGRKELGRLSEFCSMGRVKGVKLGIEYHNPAVTPDESIVDTATRLNAMIYTRDQGMQALAITNGIFCLTK
jgi:ribonuclease HII